MIMRSYGRQGLTPSLEPVHHSVPQHPKVIAAAMATHVLQGQITGVVSAFHIIGPDIHTLHDGLRASDHLKMSVQTRCAAALDIRSTHSEAPSLSALFVIFLEELPPRRPASLRLPPIAHSSTQLSLPLAAGKAPWNSPIRPELHMRSSSSFIFMRPGHIHALHPIGWFHARCRG